MQAACKGLCVCTDDPVLLAQVSSVFSEEFSFVTAPPIGRQSTVKFLATADLGHAQTDGSTEFDHEQAKDDLNTTPEGTLQYVS